RLTVYYPPVELCTDNGAMIALAGALRLGHAAARPGEPNNAFTVRPRWDLEALNAPDA
ncbi:MAG TPA: tRNA (adenosine(37)-N6)-threonylcarbamoyltransferase complex transferase subunit TsaD, partial [Burkholderiales bacterium]